MAERKGRRAEEQDRGTKADHGIGREDADVTQLMPDDDNEV